MSSDSTPLGRKCLGCPAGALVAYLWRNRSLSKTSEKLNSILGILVFNFVLGGIQDTSIDNVGERKSTEQPALCNFHDTMGSLLAAIALCDFRMLSVQCFCSSVRSAF